MVFGIEPEPKNGSKTISSEDKLPIDANKYASSGFNEPFEIFFQ